MNYEKILRGILSKAYKLDAGQIDELLTAETEKDGKKVAKTDDDLENLILDADKIRIKEITKPKDGQTFSDGYKKGKKESLEDLETKAKEKFGVETDVTGLELIEAIVEEKAKAAGKPKEITDDDIKKHPVYQTMEKGFKSQLKTAETEYTTKLADEQNKFTRTSTLNTVKADAWAEVEALKPVLPANAKVAQTHKNNFLNAFNDYDFDSSADVKNPTVMKDGKVLVDAHGHTVTLKDLTKQLSADFFEFQNNNGGGNGGNDNNQHQNNGGSGAYPAGITKPKTIAEYAKIVDDPAVKLEDKQAVAKAWDEEHSAV